MPLMEQSGETNDFLTELPVSSRRIGFLKSSTHIGLRRESPSCRGDEVQRAMVCSPASPSSFDPRVPTQMTRQDREVNAMWQAPSGPVLISGDPKSFDGIFCARLHKEATPRNDPSPLRRTSQFSKLLFRTRPIVLENH